MCASGCMARMLRNRDANAIHTGLKMYTGNEAGASALGAPRNACLDKPYFFWKRAGTSPLQA